MYINNRESVEIRRIREAREEQQRKDKNKYYRNYIRG